MLPSLGSLSVSSLLLYLGREPLLVLFTAHVTLEELTGSYEHSSWIVSHLSVEVSCLCLLQFCSELFQMYRMELNDRLCLGGRGEVNVRSSLPQGTHRRVGLVV